MIPATIERALSHFPTRAAETLEEIVGADIETRSFLS
jgi:hypothetical protein